MLYYKLNINEDNFPIVRITKNLGKNKEGTVFYLITGTPSSNQEIPENILTPYKVERIEYAGDLSQYLDPISELNEFYAQNVPPTNSGINIYIGQAQQPLLIIEGVDFSKNFYIEKDILFELTEREFLYLQQLGPFKIDINDIFVDNSADASIISFAAGLYGIGGGCISVDFVNIQKGPDAGKWFLFWTYYMGVGVGFDIGLSVYDIIKDENYSPEFLTSEDFEGWSKQSSVGLGFFGGGYIEGYSEKPQNAISNPEIRTYKGNSIGLSYGLTDISVIIYTIGYTNLITHLN